MATSYERGSRARTWSDNRHCGTMAYNQTIYRTGTDRCEMAKCATWRLYARYTAMNVRRHPARNLDEAVSGPRRRSEGMESARGIEPCAPCARVRICFPLWTHELRNRPLRPVFGTLPQRRPAPPFSLECLSDPNDGRMRRVLHFAPGSRWTAAIRMVGVL